MSRVLDLWRGMTGTVLDFAGTAAPTGWLLCFGQSLLRADYPALFAAIGTTYGAVDGTHFTLPDARGRVAAGKDDMGGVAASRLTNTGTGNPGIDGATLGASGGVDRHAVTVPQTPGHTHPVKYSSATYTSGAGTLVQTLGTGGLTADSDSTGGGEAHPNAQPTLVLNKIIKA